MFCHVGWYALVGCVLLELHGAHAKAPRRRKDKVQAGFVFIQFSQRLVTCRAAKKVNTSFQIFSCFKTFDAFRFTDVVSSFNPSVLQSL